MISPESVPKRSPRGHRDFYPRHQPSTNRSDSVQNCSSARALQELQVEPSQESPEPSTPELDRQGLAEISDVEDDYPPPPPPLSYNSVKSNELAQPATHNPPPSTGAATKQPSTYAETTQPPSTYAGTTQPPSTYAGTTQPPSTYAGTTQSPSTYAGTTQPPSTYAGTTQPPSTYVGTTQPPTTYAGTTEPPSTFAPTTQEPPPNAGATQPSPSYPQGTSPVPSQTVLDCRFEGAAGSHGSGEVSPAEEEKQKDLHHLFVHLNRSTVNQQKSTASAFGVVQVGNKKVRAARLFVVISGMMERMKRKAIELLEEKGLEKGKDFKTQFELTVQRWGEREEGTVIPHIADLEAQGGPSASTFAAAIGTTHRR